MSHAWLIDPSGRTLEVLGREADGKWKILATHADDERARAAPFDAVELGLGALWLAP